jgi:sterol desaturase/sphingolipid hydroxylase (fatty acid hydroxylase superfamily)
LEVSALFDQLLYEYSYLSLFGLAFAYFLLLYFLLAPGCLAVCRLLARNNWLQKIDPGALRNKQVQYEIWHSLQSIVVFGFSILPIIFFIRNGQIQLLPDSTINIVWSLIALSLWNEVHFFLIHRLMHLPFFMQHVHYVHHRSKIPTVYTVYSFHWLEALLLSTVPLTILLLVPLSIVAVFTFPIVSLLFNLAAHCNYRVGEGKGGDWRFFATTHHSHHRKGRGSFGFVLPYLDRLFQTKNTKKP